jgi:uncharacterized protein with PQ loop repeat
MSRNTVAPAEESTGRLQALLCVAALFVSVALTRPFVEMGINDDWSYARSAQILADTGHVVYNGWGAMMLGWQLLIGALFIKLFGFSFAVARLSTFLVALLTTYLLHRTLRQIGINNWNATAGTLLLMLSPISLLPAATYMSDIPGFFAILVCLYCCIRALQSSAGNAALTWLCVAGLSNIILGTVRQISWLGVLVLVPCTAWLLRKRKGLLPAGAALWIVGVIAIFGCLRWFARQPYSVPEKLISGPVDKHIIGILSSNVLRVPLSVALLALPLLIAFVFTRGAVKQNHKVLLIAGAVTAVAFIVGYIRVRQGYLLEHITMPWLGHLVDARGVLYGILVGYAPIILGRWIRTILSLLTIFATAACIVRLAITRTTALTPNQSPSIQPFQLHVLLLPLALSYFGLMLPRAAFHDVQDRYLVTPLFIAAVYLLWYYQRQVAAKLPPVSIAFLILFSAYSIAGTHDLFSLDRARLAAANELLAAGVPRNHIGAGFDYDGWTQITEWGYMNDPGIVNPPGAYHPPLHPGLKPCTSIFADWTPAVVPEFVLSYDQDCLSPSPYPSVAYRTWLPPRDLQVYIRAVH